jgi:hypothetical protein
MNVIQSIRFGVAWQLGSLEWEPHDFFAFKEQIPAPTTGGFHFADLGSKRGFSLV